MKNKMLVVVSIISMCLSLYSTDLIDVNKYENDPQYQKFVDLLEIPKDFQDFSSCYVETKELIRSFSGITVNNTRYASFVSDNAINESDSNRYQKSVVLLGENGGIYNLFFYIDKSGTHFSKYIKNESHYAMTSLTPEWYASRIKLLSIGNIWSAEYKDRDIIYIFHKCVLITLRSLKEDENKYDIAQGIVNYIDRGTPSLDPVVCNTEPFVSLWDPNKIRTLLYSKIQESNTKSRNDIPKSRKALVCRTDYEREIVQELADKIKKNPSDKFEDNLMRDKVTLEKVQSMGLVRRTWDDLSSSPYNDLECANGFVENCWISQKDNPSMLQGVRIGVIYGLSNQEAIEAIAALRVMYSNPRVYSFVSEQSIEKMQDQARRFAKSSISLGDRCFQGTDPRTSDLTPLKKRGYELFFLVGNTAVMVVSYDENASNIVLEIATQIEQVLTGKKKSFTPLKTVSGPADSSK